MKYRIRKGQGKHHVKVGAGENAEVKTYGPGDVVPGLSDATAKAHPDRFEPVVGQAPAPAAPSPRVESDWSHISDLPVESVLVLVKALRDMVELATIRGAEEKGRNRKTVLSAVDARLEELA